MAMLELKNLVPKTYSNSRDYKAVLKLFELIVNSSKSHIETFPMLLNPDLCPDNYLPLLASYVGYKYDYNEKMSANRLIIKYYPYLIRNRGSVTGISLATSLAINCHAEFNDLNMDSMFWIDYERDVNIIKIYIYYHKRLSKLYDLIEVVRPAGVGLEVVPAIPIKADDKIIISDIYEAERFVYDEDRYNISDMNRIGFGEIARYTWGQ